MNQDLHVGLNMFRAIKFATKFSALSLLMIVLVGCGGDPNLYTGKFRIAPNPQLKEYSLFGDALPTPESILTAPHKQMMLRRENILSAIEQDNLQDLETFAGLSNEEICELIMQEIEVGVDSADSELYEIRFAGKSKHNSRFVVDSLFGQYRQYCSGEFNKATHGWFQRHDQSRTGLVNQEDALRRQMVKDKSALAKLKDPNSDGAEKQRLEDAIAKADQEIERLYSKRETISNVLREYQKTNGGEHPLTMQSLR